MYRDSWLMINWQVTEFHISNIGIHDLPKFQPIFTQGSLRPGTPCNILQNPSVHSVEHFTSNCKHLKPHRLDLSSFRRSLARCQIPSLTENRITPCPRTANWTDESGGCPDWPAGFLYWKRTVSPMGPVCFRIRDFEDNCVYDTAGNEIITRP